MDGRMDGLELKATGVDGRLIKRLPGLVGWTQG